MLSKGLVGEGVQLHREEKVFLVPGTGAEIRQVLGKKSRGMIFYMIKMALGARGLGTEVIILREGKLE